MDTTPASPLDAFGSGGSGGSGGSAGTTPCATCGAALAPGATVCANCGTAVAQTTAAASAWPTGPAAPPPAPPQGPPAWLDAPTLPASSAPQPGAQPMGWSTTLPTTMPAMAGGMAGLATTPVAPAPAPARSRRGLLATIAAVCLVAILGGGAYWAYAAFLNPSQQLEAARFLPDTTVAYASLDLIALGSNSHHFSTSDATGQPSVGDALKTSLGLDWKTDVLPWLGRSIAIGAFSGPKTGGSSNIEGALLLTCLREERCADERERQRPHGHSRMAL